MKMQRGLVNSLEARADVCPQPTRSYFLQRTYVCTSALATRVRFERTISGIWNPVFSQIKLPSRISDGRGSGSPPSLGYPKSPKILVANSWI